MPLLDFIRSTLESTFFSLPLEGPLNFIYLFLNFSLIMLATFGSLFDFFSG